MGLTSVGETAGDAGATTRVQAVVEALRGAGFEAEHEPNVMGLVWQKFAVNCAVNAIAATTGLRGGEIVRLPELDAFQDRVLEEIMAVTHAKGIELPNPEIAAKIKAQCHKKFNKPSMLQHVEAGRRTEIEALNGALIREAKALGIKTPNNEALVALRKGRELHQQRRTHEPDLDYDAWEARIAGGEV
jgi:2-dehydropantoate 2-reductase